MKAEAKIRINCYKLSNGWSNRNWNRQEKKKSLLEAQRECGPANTLILNF